MKSPDQDVPLLTLYLKSNSGMGLEYAIMKKGIFSNLCRGMDKPSSVNIHTGFFLVGKASFVESLIT